MMIRPMTITEKILAEHAGLREAEPGQLINAKVDLILANDITAPMAIEEFQRVGAAKVFDPAKIALIPDHFVPNKDIKSAQQCLVMRNFAKEQKIVHYYEVGEMGIEHALLPEQGIVLPGDLVVGADSHTCTYGALGAFSTGVGSTDFAAAMITGEVWFRVPETIKIVYQGRRRPWVDGKDLILYTIGKIGVDGALYKAMEFTGETIANLPMDSRLTMANMAVEAGGKNGIIAPDRITKDYVQSRAKRPYKFFHSDSDARYSQILEMDVSRVEPQVAFPHLPSNVKPISAVGDVAIDQAVIGSCTNGRLDDLRTAARVLKGKKRAPYVRLIIIPATQEVYRQAMKEGLMEIFLDANAVISTPTCGPCLGGYMGILGKGERAVTTTNRNFVGRMGHPESEVYLANAAVAAASAVLGKLGSPEEVGVVS
jgi:3-isopropylmalate/(R)-2-methylmalate dehydratase large subunit